MQSEVVLLPMNIFVSAKPLARTEHVEQIDASHVAVSVAAPPRNGAANDAIARALAKHFGIAPSAVRLVSGFSSRQKVFTIP